MTYRRAMQASRARTCAYDVRYSYRHESKQLVRTVSFRLGSIPFRVSDKATHMGPVGTSKVFLSAKRLRKALTCYEIGEAE